MAGVVGYLIAILDAFLVNGFNPRNVTSITVSGNVATATTSTTHGYMKLGQLLLILVVQMKVYLMMILKLSPFQLQHLLHLQ